MLSADCLPTIVPHYVYVYVRANEHTFTLTSCIVECPAVLCMRNLTMKKAGKIVTLSAIMASEIHPDQMEKKQQQQQ